MTKNRFSAVSKLYFMKTISDWKFDPAHSTRKWKTHASALLPARCSRAGPVRTLLNLEADPAELDLIRLIRPEKSNNAVVNLPPTRVAKSLVLCWVYHRPASRVMAF